MEQNAAVANPSQANGESMEQNAAVGVPEKLILLKN